jgi:energy-converting hydrogenase Eha subunit F
MSNKTDQRLHNLYYRKSKLESVNETSALLSGFAIVSFLFLNKIFNLKSFQRLQLLNYH